MIDYRWEFSTTPPPEWGELIGRLNGGFYHTPLGLLLSSAAGEPLYCTLRDPRGDVVGIALGAQRRCRLSSRPRHLSFPSLPALGAHPDPEAALTSLLAQLAARGAAEVDMSTYDTPWTPPADSKLLTGSLRQEYVVDLHEDPQILRRSFGKTHRRSCSRGEREGWELRQLHGATAVAALNEVMATTATRVHSHGRSYSIAVPIATAASAVYDDDAPGRAVTLAAFHGDTLLGAGLAGIAGRRGYLVISGSTTEGYRIGSAPWLWWRIMVWLHERGANTFNLGGSPGSPLTASDPDDPHHGLYVYKMGFGAVIVRSRCGHWEFGHNHIRLHRLTARLGAVAGR